jgi:hypothetical protein
MGAPQQLSSAPTANGLATIFNESFVISQDGSAVRSVSRHLTGFAGGIRIAHVPAAGSYKQITLQESIRT